MTLNSEVRIERDTSVPTKTTPRNAATPAKSLMALVTAYDICGPATGGDAGLKASALFLSASGQLAWYEGRNGSCSP